MITVKAVILREASRTKATLFFKNYLDRYNVVASGFESALIGCS